MNKPTPQNEEVILKPCPFCGTGNSKVDLYENEYGFWQIGCGRCGSHSGISKDKTVVRTTWNTRNE